MPIDPAMLAKSIGTLADLDPTRDLAATLKQAVDAAKQLFDASAAGVMLADLHGTLRWATASDQRAQTLEDNQEVFAAGPCAGGEFMATWYDRFPGGCVTSRLHLTTDPNGEFAAQAPEVLGFTTRQALRAALYERSGGRLQLDPGDAR